MLVGVPGDVEASAEGCHVLERRLEPLACAAERLFDVSLQIDRTMAVYADAVARLR